MTPFYHDWSGTKWKESWLNYMVNGKNAQGNLVNAILWYICPKDAVWSTRDPRVNWWTSTLRDNWEVIRDEYMALKSKADLLQWSNLYGRPDWNQVTFYHAGRDNINLERYFPKTLELVRRTPITHAMISIVGPGKTIGLHYGEFKGILRYHLAIDIPEYTEEDFGTPIVGSGRFAPIHLGVYDKVPFRGGLLGSWPFRRHRDVYLDVLDGFKIYNDSIAEQMNPVRMEWKHGEDLLFDDGFPHYVQNLRNKSRAILFADIPRMDVPYPLWWLLRNLYVHFLPLTSHWVKDMELQHRGLHKAFNAAMDADLGEEGFEFHEPEKETANVILLFGIPSLFLLVGLVFCFKTKISAIAQRLCFRWKRSNTKSPPSVEMAPGCEKMVKKGIKEVVYDKQA
mmetsp:Transcript_34220/g.66655  ORF Transcript_34220/g.66655 Transcript_34220/m.66655 type:complete len:396 (+) Transcript_34220:97-1284(+)